MRGFLGCSHSGNLEIWGDMLFAAWVGFYSKYKGVFNMITLEAEEKGRITKTVSSCIKVNKVTINIHSSFKKEKRLDEILYNIVSFKLQRRKRRINIDFFKVLCYNYSSISNMRCINERV